MAEWKPQGEAGSGPAGEHAPQRAVAVPASSDRAYVYARSGDPVPDRAPVWYRAFDRQPMVGAHPFTGAYTPTGSRVGRIGWVDRTSPDIIRCGDPLCCYMNPLEADS